ncbi:hypothetical protein [Pelagerythrobacter marinus]|uniref:hypothetical protein n=1 Tax=Pelagerythrobacter marinus TaxID=538382 RepID=UPI002AC9AF87|nr:hypothetical protein [Pelagerythrobacter marinus]WPZ05495.1 hypothetical protein T8T98_08620 [Pelagerythrobacter marinus]
MAHQQQDAGAVDVPVTHTVDSAAAALSQAFQQEPEEHDEGQDEDPNVNDEFADEDFAEEGEEIEGEEEQGEGGDEPDEPAIDAPVSLTADEKEEFSQLPKEAQDYVTRLEQRRNSDVQKITTKAAEAQRVAEAKAAEADNEAKQRYASQLKQFVSAFEPQAPDPQLAYSDPQRFVAMKAQYDAHKAQHDELVQQVESISAEADEEAQRAFVAQRDRELMAIPEIANEETRKAYLDKAMGVATELGYDISELAANMSASDVKALAQAADWKAKAEKYDMAMSRQMKRVRAGKKRALKPGAAQPKGSGNRALSQAKQRLAQTGSVDDAAAAFKEILS